MRNHRSIACRDDEWPVRIICNLETGTSPLQRDPTRLVRISDLDGTAAVERDPRSVGKSDGADFANTRRDRLWFSARARTLRLDENERCRDDEDDKEGDQNEDSVV